MSLRLRSINAIFSQNRREQRVLKDKIWVTVAPRTGAWIETTLYRYFPRPVDVAPRTGAWIETSADPLKRSIKGRRSPHGSVD